MGRQPNTDGLGLDLAGVKTDERGYVSVDEQCRSRAEGVWAVGDCNGRGAFTHTAWNDHEIVVANLFDNDPRRLGQRIPCYALFIDPPLGRIGASEAEVRKSGKPALRATMPMQRVGRAREAGETQGFSSSGSRRRSSPRTCGRCGRAWSVSTERASWRCSTAVGHSKLESTVRGLGVDVHDALEISEQTEI